MKVKKVKIPRVIDLGCNNKAKALVDAKGNALLLSYDSPIAYAVWEGGTRRTLYRLAPCLCSSTTSTHWTAFFQWEGHPELVGNKAYSLLPLAVVQPV